MSNIEFFELSGEWDPPPELIAAAVDDMDARFQDTTIPLAASREVVIDDVREHFEQEKAPSGERWQDWAPSYAPTAIRENIGILRKTLDLYNAATDPAAYPLFDNTLWINTNGFPDYWKVHQEGGMAGGKAARTRRDVKISRGDKDATKYNKIPPRPYLGMSAEAEVEVLEIWDQWFEDQSSLLFSPLTGTVHTRVPTGRGRETRIGPRVGATQRPPRLFQFG